MAGFDADVFGGGAGFDPDVFGAPQAKKQVTNVQIAAQIANDPISQGARNFTSEGSDALGGVSQAALNLLAGGVRGAGSIGATIARPFESSRDNAERRARIDETMRAVGAQPDSWVYQGGKLGGEIAGTAAVPGMAARFAGALLPTVGVSAPVANAISTGLATGGFRVPGMSGVPALAARMGTGAVGGGLAAGMVDPSQAGDGALIGGLLPPFALAAGRAGQAISDAVKSGARTLMQSAVKPTLAQLKSGEAATAINTMLEKGVSPNAAGVQKLQGLIDAADDQISKGIANSSAVIDKTNTLGPALQTRAQFAAQVCPGSDLQAIDSAVAGYLNHPGYPGMTLPVQDAQALKQGTYRVLAKKYGQMGSADTEAQKALARGLKDEIANAVPGVADANAELSRLLATMNVAERRALMDSNKNPIGLGLLSPSKAGLLAFMADRSAALKAMTARGMYSAADVPVMGLLGNPTLVPYVRQGLLSTEASP
jgi:hypothetical protein